MARVHGHLQPRGAHPAHRARVPVARHARDRRQPVGRAVRRPSGDGDRPDPRHRGRDIASRPARRGAASPTRRADPASNRTSCACWKEPRDGPALRSHRHRPDRLPQASRPDARRSSCGSAALEAVEDAGLTFADIDAIVIGKAPDALEGVMMPELSLADALGAVGKPIHRVHTAGSVGASTAITGRHARGVGSLRPRARRLLREAVGGQRHVGALGRAFGRAGRGRHVRAVDPRATSGDPARPSTSGGWSRSRTASTRSRTRTRTCASPTSRSTRSRSPRCCGTRCTSSSRAHRRTGRRRS